MHWEKGTSDPVYGLWRTHTSQKHISKKSQLQFISIKFKRAFVRRGDLPKPRCNDRGIAYVIRHNADGVEYVGETSRQIGIRLAEHLKPVFEEQIRRFKENKKGEHTCSAVAAYCMEKHNGNFDVSIGLLSKGKNCAHRLALENNGIELRQAGMNRMHDGVNIG